MPIMMGKLNLHIVRQCALAVLLLLSSHIAMAAYSFPAVFGAPLPPGCSGTNGIYTCLFGLKNVDQPININNSAQAVTITITGNMLVNENITVNSATHTVTFHISGNLTTGQYGFIASNLADSATNVALFVRGNVNITSSTIKGSIYTTGNGYINFGSPGVVPVITGSLETNNGTIDVYGTVQGCIKSSRGSVGDILLANPDAEAGGVNCASNGTTSCVDNFSGRAMPALCKQPTLIASYHFDEARWNGTANEVKDNAGYTGGPFDGQGIGFPVPRARPYTANPARAGSIGTCGYADFVGATNGGSAFTLDNLPVNTVPGNETSVSFWMYWNGSTSVNVLVGWDNYNLELTQNHIGFNTLNTDLYGTSASGLDNKWVHIAAIFNNGDAESSTLYINGVRQTLSRIYFFAPPNNANAQVTSNLNVGAVGGTTNYRFINGSIDEVKVYKGGVTQAQVTADYNATHSCLANIVPANFNCTVVGGASDTGRLYTQLAGTNFSVDVIALKADGSVETNYVPSGTKDVNLEFVDGAACSIPAVPNPTASQTVTFASADQGRKRVDNINISKAHRDLRCRVTDANQFPSVVGCSSDNFSVRPNGFEVTSGNANADNAGGSATATPAIKAGASFNLIATAKNAINATVLGYDGTPVIDSSKINAHAGAVQVGNVSGLFSAANATTGIATGASFNYSEVGYFNFAANGVYDNTFTSVDAGAGDCVAGFAASGGKYGCSFGNTAASNYFGRFTPDHFAMTTGANTEGCDSGNFTYFGQDGLTTAFTLTAQNASKITTQNYAGTFAKLDLTNWANYNFTSDGILYSPALSASATAPTGTWVSGSASVSAKHKTTTMSQYLKCADENSVCSFSGTRTVIYGANNTYTIGEFTNGVACSNSVFGNPLFGVVKACYLKGPPSPTTVTVLAKPTDSDGVTAMSSAAVSAASLFRYGRLMIPNVYGSELLPLSVPIEAQYWNGSAYQRNQQDSCSVILANTIAMGNYKSNLTACETQLSGAGTLNAGKTTVNLTKPGAGNSGSVDLTVNLNGASGNTCNSATASGAGNANMPWFGNNPNARATFGLFKTPVIYMRENF